MSRARVADRAHLEASCVTVATLVGGLLAVGLAGGPARLDAQQAPPPGTAPWSSPALSHVPLPNWLSLSGEMRMRMEHRDGLGYQAGVSDGYGLVRTRLNVEVRPTSAITLYVQGQDARAPGILATRANGVFRDPFDLRQAYAQLRLEDLGAALTAGRQLLLYGDQRLIGPLDWTNTSRAFDAVKLGVAAGAVDVDVFSGRVVRNDPGRALNRSDAGNALHGIYATVRPGERLTVEPFALWRTLEAVPPGGDADRFSGGARVLVRLGALESSLTYVEQWGSFGTLDISARALSIAATHRFEAPMSPMVRAELNYASGDSDPADGRLGSFDDMFPTAHLYYGYNDLVGLRNIRNVRVGASVQPWSDVTLTADFHTFSLANGADGLYNVAGALTVPAPAGGAADRRVGEEVDVTFSVRLAPTMSLSGGVGRLFAGPFLEANTPGASNTFAHTALSVRF